MKLNKKISILFARHKKELNSCLDLPIITDIIAKLLAIMIYK